MVVGAVFVEVFHFTLIQNRFFEPIFRPEPMVDNGAGPHVAELCLHHSSPVSRRNVLVVHDLKELAIVQDGIPAAELCCLNHYKSTPVRYSKREL